MTKQEIRSFIKEEKKKLSSQQIQANSSEIIKHLFHHISLHDFKKIFCYVPFNQEVNTTPIIEYALAHNIEVAVPKINENEMKFFSITSMEELKPGVLGILEPDIDINTKNSRELIPSMMEPSLCIVPGLAFDRKKNRIGYGKGYYDRYFERFTDYPMLKIALAYDFQLLTELPVGDYDIKINQIITQTEMIQ